MAKTLNRLERWFRAMSAMRPVQHGVLAALLLAGAMLVGETLGAGYARSKVTAALATFIGPQRDGACPSSGGARDGDAAGRATATPQPGARPSSWDAALPGLGTYAGSDTIRQRIADYAAKIRRMECLHAEALVTYVSNYYMAVVVALVFGGIAALALVFIGKNGWAAANPYLVNVLVTAAAIGAFVGAYPKVFQQPEMIAAHRAQLLRYVALLDGMASHVAAPRVVPLACIEAGGRVEARVRDTAFPPEAFVACLDAATATPELPFALDTTYAPDYRRAVGTQPP